MIPYWILLLGLSIGSLLYQQRATIGEAWPVPVEHRIRRDPALIIVLIAITLLIGLRYKVGGDWKIYQFHFELMSQLPFDQGSARVRDEIGYSFVNWASARAGGDIWLVNLVCAIPFVIGLSALSRQQPNPWLALAVATPLIIIVIGMGYTRQAAALGFVLVGLSSLIRGRSYWNFSAWVLAGSFFHQSALVLIPLVPLFLLRFRALSLLLIVLASVIGYYVLLPRALDRYSVGYINQIYQAKGAIYRIGPNAATGLLLLVFPKQFDASPIERKIWRGWAYLSLVILGAFFVVPSTVILDRLSVYVAPLQVWVWSRLPTAFGEDGRPHLLLTMLVLAYSATVLALWFAFANHSQFWVPYRLYPFLDPSRT